jgi:putative Holliday junction resolvase
MTRTLGVDYGTKRIGLAISDDLGLMARPLEVVRRADLMETLSRMVDEYDVATVVVGLPTSLAGHEGASASEARELGSEIAARLGIPVTYVDERFTTRMAESALIETGMRRRSRRNAVDKAAAAIILQTYLDSVRSPRNPDGPVSVEDLETDDD